MINVYKAIIVNMKKVQMFINKMK